VRQRLLGLLDRADWTALIVALALSYCVRCVGVQAWADPTGEASPPSHRHVNLETSYRYVTGQ
jgi:hypothetical protein